MHTESLPKYPPVQKRRQLLRLLKISLKTGDSFLKAGTSAGNVRFNSRRKQSAPAERETHALFQAYRIENPAYPHFP
ncbi:hypothetical protein AKKM5201_07700 [Akkermansia muciniphila]|nr:hypothetical protein AKKM5201_07700 [Akkermansia muciniphila]